MCRLSVDQIELLGGWSKDQCKKTYLARHGAGPQGILACAGCSYQECNDLSYFIQRSHALDGAKQCDIDRITNTVIFPFLPAFKADVDKVCMYSTMKAILSCMNTPYMLENVIQSGTHSVYYMCNTNASKLK